MLNYLQRLGASGLDSLATLGRAGQLWWLAMTAPPDWREGPRLLVRQLYFIGVYSLIIIVVSGVFIGMVLALQGYTVLVRFGADQALGQLVSLSLLRRRARPGSRCPAVRGSRRLGPDGRNWPDENHRAIGIDGDDRQHRPHAACGASRLLAGTIAMPLLAQIFNMVAIWGAVAVGVDWLHVDAGSFWANMQNSVEFYEDVVNGTISPWFSASLLPGLPCFRATMQCRPRRGSAQPRHVPSCIRRLPF